MRNIVQHGEDTLEGDITLFRDSIMPTLRYRYPLMYRRVKELWRKRIIEISHNASDSCNRLGKEREEPGVDKLS